MVCPIPKRLTKPNNTALPLLISDLILVRHGAEFVDVAEPDLLKLVIALADSAENIKLIIKLKIMPFFMILLFFVIESLPAFLFF